MEAGPSAQANGAFPCALNVGLDKKLLSMLAQLQPTTTFRKKTCLGLRTASGFSRGSDAVFSLLPSARYHEDSVRTSINFLSVSGLTIEAQGKCSMAAKRHTAWVRTREHHKEKHSWVPHHEAITRRGSTWRAAGAFPYAAPHRVQVNPGDAVQCAHPVVMALDLARV